VPGKGSTRLFFPRKLGTAGFKKSCRSLEKMKDDVCLDKEAEPPNEETEPPGETICSDDACYQRFAIPLPLERRRGSQARSKSSQNGPRFVISQRSDDFRKRHFSGISLEEWNDWHWQVRNRILGVDSLSRILSLSHEEREAILHHSDTLPLAITPYYASLLKADDPLQPLRRTVVPVDAECRVHCGEAADPLGEENDSPVPGIVHRYPDRVLFLVTRFCSTYCRYCTRSRMVGRSSKSHFSMREWEQAIAYIEKTPAIRDVLISGGDPLTLNNERLEWLLSRLRRIPHVELLRIGTKVPAVMPQRVTLALTRLLKRYHPLWMSIHFTHPDELTPEVNHACNRLADAGIPLGSQTVLLSQVNDSVETMKKLVHGLLKMRVRPYYLYQCDPIPGSTHFRTPVAKGLEIIQGLRGHTSGYAVPTYVIDAPDGGGKIPLLPEYVVGREGDYLLLRNFEGNTYRYPDLKP
jgi:lysine 2,3-aminomutase